MTKLTSKDIYDRVSSSELVNSDGQLVGSVTHFEGIMKHCELPTRFEVETVLHIKRLTDKIELLERHIESLNNQVKDLDRRIT